MLRTNIKILVTFVEPMIYGMDLIHEVYENTSFEFQYLYCHKKVTGHDTLSLPPNSIVCEGTNQKRKVTIRKILKNFCPDFVVINGYVGLEQTLIMRYCMKNEIPYGIETDTPLHIPDSKWKALIKKLYLKYYLNNSYCYGFPGGTLQKENLVYYGIPEDRCFIMPMSVSKNRFLKESTQIPDKIQLKNQEKLGDKRIILFVGRLETVKNVNLLINAYAKLKQYNSNLALLIVGDGSERNNLEMSVKDKNIQDVYFKGYVTFPQNVKYYKMADVFVLPSTYEPWGLVVNEASIMRLPIVVSSHVGCRKDLVKEGLNGYIFEDNNEKELIHAIKKAFTLNISFVATDIWDYQKYLKNFNYAVNRICGRLN